MVRPLPLVLVFLLVAATGSHATCPPSCAVPGGGAKATDCHLEFASPGLRLNFPTFDPAAPKPGKQVRCFDGEAGCDVDGAVDGTCTFPIDVCLHNADPALPLCTPADVTAVAVQNKPIGNPSYSPGLAALQTAVDGLLPATTNVCTTGQTVAVALKAGGTRKGKRTVKLAATTTTRTDGDRVRWVSLPTGWPSHGYDRANTRASATESTISPSNASQLVPKWQFAIAGGGVSSTPTVGNGVVYATSWDGRAYALDAATGALR